MFRQIFSAAAMTAAIAMSSAAQASDTAVREDIQFEGAEVAEFVEAKADWLAGNDMEALQALSALSRDGNIAAQMLLGAIAERGHFYSHLTADMTRKEKIALLRVPKGLSGKSWFTEAQNTEPLAAAILQSKQMGDQAETLDVMMGHGEVSMALILALRLVNEGRVEEVMSGLQLNRENLPLEALYLFAQADYMRRFVGPNAIGGKMDPLLEQILTNDRYLPLRFVWGGFFAAEMVKDPEVFNYFATIAGDVPAWTPIVKFCENHCAETAEQCSAAGVGMLYGNAFELHGPLQSMIPNEEYWSSARLDGDLARWNADISRLKPEFQTLNACYFDAMTQAQSIHGYGG